MLKVLKKTTMKINFRTEYSDHKYVRGGFIYHIYYIYDAYIAEQKLSHIKYFLIYT